MQLAAPVQDRERVVGVTLGDTLDLAALVCDGGHGAKIGADARIGIKQRLAQLTQRFGCADSREIRSGKASLSPNHVTAGATAFVEKDLTAGRGVALHIA